MSRFSNKIVCAKINELKSRMNKAFGSDEHELEYSFRCYCHRITETQKISVAQCLSGIENIHLGDFM